MSENARAGRWTRTKPDRPGWWWHRCREKTLRDVFPPIVVAVFSDGPSLFIDGPHDRKIPLEDVDAYEWCGPLTPPEDDATEAGDAKGAP